MAIQNDLVDFEWLVPESGYEWIKGEPLGQLNTEDDMSIVLPFIRTKTYAAFFSFLATVDPSTCTKSTFLVAKQDLMGREDGNLKFNPFKERRELFREFADLSSDPSDVLGFANRYGNLGDDEFRTSLNPISLGAGRMLNGEPLIAWQIESSTLQQVVFVWELLKREDENSLRKHFIQLPGGRRLKGDTPAWWFWRSPEGWKDTTNRQESLMGDIRDGMLFIRDASLDEETDLSRVAQIFILQIANQSLAGRLSAEIRETSNPRGLALLLRPISLIGAIWLQFAQAVSNSTEFRRCVVCNSWMEISENASRKDKSYCSDACRMRAYRGRKKAKEQRLP